MLFVPFLIGFSNPKRKIKIFVPTPRIKMKLREICSVRHTDKLQSSRVWMSSWNHSGKLIASCGDDKTVVLWAYNEGKLEFVKRVDGEHEKAIRCVNFSHCGNYLASAGFDAVVVVYANGEHGFEQYSRMEGHESEVKCCAYSPSDEFLATCSRDKTVWLWQMDEELDYNVSSIMQTHSQDVKSVVWHPHEQLLVSCGYDSAIRFYKYDGEDWITQQRIENVHEGTVWSAAFDGEGNRLVTVGEDHKIKLFMRSNIGIKSAENDTWMKICELEVENTRWPLYSVSWNATNDLIATGGGDSKIRIFKIAGNTAENSIIEHLGVYGKHELEINSVSWCPNPETPTLLTSASDDGCIKVWNMDIL
ncbi:unnamed protein product [Caenorhabditis angaria]|uniref:Probable cytosolic iron-sulfur protein assembly protein CIAO1 homolog n=1 Tax=Caenorhabditis angaria TaxID=860376 RepID=A0A9P1MWD2_9PELO|nr:unnamed protein product [Caenorhabditis angaria]